MPSRLFAGLIVGLLVSAITALVIVLPAVLVLRLGWGVWPTPRAWLWIAGALGGQALTLAVRHGAKTPENAERRTNCDGSAHGSSPP